jgi:hypothetical protein
VRGWCFSGSAATGWTRRSRSWRPHAMGADDCQSALPARD